MATLLKPGEEGSSSSVPVKRVPMAPYPNLEFVVGLE
jgi:hypothetical protein